MSVERTFGIIKPDAVAKNAIGGVLALIEKAGLRVIGIRGLHLSEAQARGFYAVHRERPFFGDLVRFMTSGPCVVLALEGENAIARYREAMGPTDSKQAPAGTIRGTYGTDIEKNAAHGSDGPDTAKAEIAFFFTGVDLV